jgi:hypothetical protein
MTAVTQERSAMSTERTAGSPADELVRSLLHEARLVGELRAILLRQRDAVAADDGAALEAAVQEIGRALMTLGEARRYRMGLLTALGVDSPSLAEVIGYLPPADRPRFQAAREHLRAVAQATFRDLTINQAVLRRVMESGERFLQQLFGGANGAGDEAVLVNRRA